MGIYGALVGMFADRAGHHRPDVARVSRSVEDEIESGTGGSDSLPLSKESFVQVMTQNGKDDGIPSFTGEQPVPRGESNVSVNGNPSTH